MTKILVLGDIHGKTCWKDIVKKEDASLIVFLGDYVSTHEDISEKEQIDNLKEILDYKESEDSKVILLRGNHDIQHLGYNWTKCSGYFPKVGKYIQSIKERFLKDTQWIYIYEYTDGNKTTKFLLSHAGVSRVWLNNIGKSIEEINNLEPSKYFGFTPDSPNDISGSSITQPPTWIRPYSLSYCLVEDYIHIVGHTPVYNIRNLYLSTRNHTHLWLCDTLPNEYLVIKDGVPEVRRLNDNIIKLSNRYKRNTYLKRVTNNWFKLCFDSPEEFEYLGVTEDKDEIISLDPIGGPYLTRGYIIGDKEVKKIKQDHHDFLLLIE